MYLLQKDMMNLKPNNLTLFDQGCATWRLAIKISIWAGLCKPGGEGGGFSHILNAAITQTNADICCHTHLLVQNFAI